MKISAIVGALAVASGLAVGLPSAAMAGSSLCPSAKVCVYANNDFGGLLGYRSGGLGLANVSSVNNDEMSSWENKSTSNARWYHDRDAGGKCVTLLSKREDNNINFLDNDTMSSWATNGAC